MNQNPNNERALLEENQAFWEEHYQKKRTQSNGIPSGPLVRFTEALVPGRSLELGCSHGDDAIWLATRGWHVVAVDISQTALARAAAKAAEKGLSSRIDFQCRDLVHSFPAGQFELVTAFFLQTPVNIPRGKILEQAANAVAAGGLLIIAEHAAGPPWAEHKPKNFPKLEETLAALNLTDNNWQKVFLGSPEREGTGPEGQKAVLKDNLLVLKRLAHHGA